MCASRGFLCHKKFLAYFFRSVNFSGSYLPPYWGGGLDKWKICEIYDLDTKLLPFSWLLSEGLCVDSYKNQIKFSETTYIFAFLLGYLLKGSYKTFEDRLYFGLLFWLPIEGIFTFPPCMSGANGKILSNFWKSFQKYPAIRLKKFLIIVRRIFIGYSASKETNTFLHGAACVVFIFSLISEGQKLYYTFSWTLNKERPAMQRHNTSKQSAAVVRNR